MLLGALFWLVQLQFLPRLMSSWVGILCSLLAGNGNQFGLNGTTMDLVELGWVFGGGLKAIILVMVGGCNSGFYINILII